MSVYAYQVIAASFESPEAGSYSAYGIRAYRETEDRREQAAYVSDAFLDQQQAEQLAALCNRLQLDPIHLTDVIVDALG